MVPSRAAPAQEKGRGWGRGRGGPGVSQPGMGEDLPAEGWRGSWRSGWRAWGRPGPTPHTSYRLGDPGPRTGSVPGLFYRRRLPLGTFQAPDRRRPDYGWSGHGEAASWGGGQRSRVETAGIVWVVGARGPGRGHR